MTTYQYDPTQARKLWTDALRSGQYEQGSGYLHQVKDGKQCYCGIGVACAVMREHEGEAALPSKHIAAGEFHEFNTWTQGDEFYTYGSQNCAGATPQELRRWLGIHSSGALWDINDKEKKSFADIATFIETEPDRIFLCPLTN